MKDNNLEAEPQKENSHLHGLWVMVPTMGDLTWPILIFPKRVTCMCETPKLSHDPKELLNQLISKIPFFFVTSVVLRMDKFCVDLCTWTLQFLHTRVHSSEELNIRSVLIIHMNRKSVQSSL